MMKLKTHLSLFSGIGGLDLAAEASGFETVGQRPAQKIQMRYFGPHLRNGTTKGPTA